MASSIQNQTCSLPLASASVPVVATSHLAHYTRFSPCLSPLSPTTFTTLPCPRHRTGHVTMHPAAAHATLMQLPQPLPCNCRDHHQAMQPPATAMPCSHCNTTQPPQPPTATATVKPCDCDCHGTSRSHHNTTQHDGHRLRDITATVTLQAGR
jgi:hypothetical protein